MESAFHNYRIESQNNKFCMRNRDRDRFLKGLKVTRQRRNDAGGAGEMKKS